MTTAYPAGIDPTSTLKNDHADSTLSIDTHKTAHNNAADAVLAIETELGVAPSGSYATLVARLDDALIGAPLADQVITPTANVVPLALKVGASQTTARSLLIQNQAGAIVGYWNRLGVLNAAGYKVGGVALASTHLSDTADIIRNPSPTITSPTLSSPNLTGTPTATTQAVDNNTTRVATTAFVKNQAYAPALSPALTGVPTAPTPSNGDSSTRIATTAFVVSMLAEPDPDVAPTGSMALFPTSTVPSGWLRCDGTSYLRASYAALFAEIGTTYGSVDGTHFNVPNKTGAATSGTVYFAIKT